MTHASLRALGAFKPLAFCFGFAALAAAPVAATAQTELTMSTVSQTSDDYQLAIAWSNVLSEGGKYRIVPDGGSGTVRGLRLLAQGRVQLSPIGAPHYADAIQRSGSFAEDPPELVERYKSLRALFAIPTGMAQYVVRADSGIASLADLRGKRVAIGRPGGNAGRVTTILYKIHGLDVERGDYRGEYIDFGPGLEELADGKLDAVLVWGGMPHSAVYNTSRTTPVSFISPDPAKLPDFRAAITNGDYYVFREVPPDVIRAAYGQGVRIDAPMRAWTFPMMIVVNGDMDETTAYELTRTLWENVETVRSSSQALSLLDAGTATEALSTELHPGAARYFRERGLLR
jgi:TRAP transporter TAXI family solute receptor